MRFSKRLQRLMITASGLLSISVSPADEAPLRIMPLGDSITAGYTDNPVWNHPFEFGYRSGLYKRLTAAGYRFQFVGKSPEPFDKSHGDPTRGGTVVPAFDLRPLKQDKHRGYGGWTIPMVAKNITNWIAEDKPDVILLMIGINGMKPDSPQQLDALVNSIFTADKNIRLVVAQIAPKSTFGPNVTAYNSYIKETLLPAYQAKGRTIRTVEFYPLFLTDPANPESIDTARFANQINHPLNSIYDQMAAKWFDAIQSIVPPPRK